MSEELEVLLDTRLCVAYGICVSIMPDVFDTPRGSSTAVLLRTRVGLEERDDLEEAVRNCPAQALAIGETPS